MSLQQRWGALPGAILGVVWSLAHMPSMVLLGQSPIWIAWGFLDMIATRVIMTWLYNTRAAAYSR